MMYNPFSSVGIYRRGCKKEMNRVSQKKREQERQWKARKENQEPHGKVKTFAELVDETKKT